jgi:hypothetical protein
LLHAGYVADGGKKKDGSSAFRVVDENGYVIPQEPKPKSKSKPKSESQASAPDSDAPQPA